MVCGKNRIGFMRRGTAAGGGILDDGWQRDAPGKAVFSWQRKETENADGGCLRFVVPGLRSVRICVIRGFASFLTTDFTERHG